MAWPCVPCVPCPHPEASCGRGSEMGEAVLAEELRSEVSGAVLHRGDADFEQARPDYAAAGEPAIIVRPEAPDEVGRVVRYAAKRNLPLSVRSGGHGAAAFANPDGLVLDLSQLDEIDVHADGTVRIGGGASWGAVADRLQEEGLALTSGDTRSVGVGGLTLGGGIGWMVRGHGLALDSLASAEVVLASGETVTASETENSDLFWAIRGGGGNFGVVTAFTFRAHPLDRVVFGTLTFGLDDLPGLLRGWRDAMRVAPEELNTTVLAMPSFGEAPPTAQVLVCWSGQEDQADAAIAPLLALPGLLRSELKPIPYAEVLEEPQKPEGPITIVDYNGLAADFDDATIDAIVSAREGVAMSVLMVRYLRGAFNRVDADATAFAH